MTTKNLNITKLISSQSQKEVTINEALIRIDAILNVGAIDRDINIPPGLPNDGDLYIIGLSPIGDWASNADGIAYYQQQWNFITPSEGMRIWVNDEDRLYVFDGTNWLAVCDKNSALNGAATGVVTVDFAVSRHHELLVTGNITTLWVNNPPVSEVAGSMRVIFTQDATGSRTISWPASFKWEGASAPVLSTAANAVDILEISTSDNGTTYYAKLIKNMG
jgi:hypothetical protein